MSTTSSRLSFTDCYAFLDESLAGKRGGRLYCATYEAANWMRMRLHTARSIDRKDNREIYPDPSEPLHGRSQYDILTLKLREDTEGNWWVYAIKNELNMARVERLEGDEEILMVEAEEVRMLEDQSGESQS